MDIERSKISLIMSKGTNTSTITKSKSSSLIDHGTSPVPNASLQSQPTQVFAQKLESLMKPNEFQDFLFRLFTYTIILLPTLTSIIFPISSSISTSEHVGNLIIDLLTVLLLSMVVRYTMEWPYTWLRQLQRTKITLLKEMNQENTDRTILLVRKIYTFEIIALFSCLISSVFSSALLIWTRQYTIIDQKRKKVVFNNVNIALLQFWSIFRIIITFTNSLQESSLNSNQLYWESPQLNSWYQDLKHYFIPSASNQILLDHLQQHNRQFDQMKLELKNLQNEIDDLNKRNFITQRSRKNTFTPYPLNVSVSAPCSPRNTMDQHAFSSSSPVCKTFQSKPISNFSPPAPRRIMNEKLSPKSKNISLLNTIVEEDDDNTLYESIENSYTNFDEIITTPIQLNSTPSILEELSIVLKTISNQGSIFEIIKHPNNFCQILMTEMARLSKLHFELGEYQFVKLLLSEVFERYFLDIYQKTESQLQAIMNYPIYHLRNTITYLMFKLPVMIMLSTISWMVYMPILFINWVFIKPNLLAIHIAWITLKLIFATSTPEKPCSKPPPKLVSPGVSNREVIPLNPLPKENNNIEKFAMKPFHLSPTLNNLALFVSPIKKRKPTSLSLAMPVSKLLIETTPALSNSINGGIRNYQTHRYQNSNNFALFED